MKGTTMGKTHYWQRGTELPAKAFAPAVEDCRIITEAIGIPLGGFDGTGEPIFLDDAMIFNGKEREACEPFEIHQTEFDRRGREVFWSFCKTDNARYDISVQACLIVLKHHLGVAISVGSDGNDEDWAAARTICQKRLGYGDDFLLDKEPR